MSERVQDQTHEGIERFLSPEQLAIMRNHIKSKRLVIRRIDNEEQDACVEAFLYGAMFLVEVLKHHKLTMQVTQRELVEAAQFFYPPYDPLPEPTKNNDAGNAPPLRTIHKG